MKKLFFVVMFIALGFYNLQAQTECEKDTLNLSLPDISWGKPVKGSSGKLIFCREFKKYFTGQVILKGLTPNHNYMLTLNSKPGGSGGENLPEKYGNERKWDFQPISTDSLGNCSKTFKAKMQPKDYGVKFFVKDMDDDFRIVLYNDFLFFEVTE